MWRFKKPKKSHQPSQRPASLVVPTHIALGPLSLGADLDLDSEVEGVFHSANLAADRSDLITAAGENDGGGSRIVPQDRGGYQRLQGTGASTPTSGIPTSGRSGSVTRGCIPQSPIGPVLMIPIALYGREQERERKREHERDRGRELRRELPQNPLSEQPSHDAPDLHHIEMKSEVQSQVERKGQVTISGGPPKLPPTSTFVDDRPGEGVRYAVQFKGECRRSSDVPSIHVHLRPSVPEGVGGDTADPRDVPKEAVDGFGPLRAKLGAISATQSDHKVRS